MLLLSREQKILIRYNMKRVWLFTLCFVAFFQLNGTAQEGALDKYIHEALQSNLAIKQRHVSLENAMYALKKAKYNYIPTVNFEGIYTTAEGGRSYEIPDRKSVV